MVPIPLPSAIVAFAGLLRLIANVSVGSNIWSPRTATVIVLLVSPGVKVSVPLVVRKSLPADAVPLVRRDVEEGIRAAERAVDAAKASLVLAEEDYSRYSGLYRDGAVTERKFQEATRTIRTARADVQIAEAKLGQAEANRKQIDIAEQQLRAARSAVSEGEKAVELAELGTLQIEAARRLVKRAVSTVREEALARSDAA